MKKYLLLLCAIVFIGTTKAQINETETTMLWTTIGVSKKINKKMDVSYYQLHSLSFNKGKFNFIQPDLALSYKLNKKWVVGINYTPTISIDTVQGNQSLFHRVSGRVKLKTKLGKRFRMTNYIVAEHHFTQRSKFQQRYYYRLDLYYRGRRFPWKLRPFINQKLYLYSNGRLLQYYDVDGNKTDLKSPNGLHAYRLQTGIKLYPTKKITLAAYFLKQKEFNAGGNDINALNTNSNKIRRPFYNFSVIGVSLNYKL